MSPILHTHLLPSLAEHLQYIQEIAPLSDGKQYFAVGGAVRDLLLGITPTLVDVDLTCGVHPDIIKEAIRPSDEISVFDTEKYGTITIIDQHTKTNYEITPFRAESGYSDIRHPDQIERTQDLIADSGRRDFTINAMYATTLAGYTLTDMTARDDHSMKILTQQGYIGLTDDVLIIQDHDMIQHIVEQTYDTLPLQRASGHTVTVILDPQHGIDDIIHSKLRAVGNPLMRMHEDALRILRALRFVNQLNQHPNIAIDFEKSTRKALQKSFPLVTTLPKERLHQELMKVFGGKNPFGYIALIDELHLLNTLFPALARCKHNDQPTRHHPFDTYAHTLLVLYSAQQRNSNPYLKLAALYHDVGKVDQYAYYSLGIDGDEKSLPAAIMIRHPELGVTLAQQDFKKLGFSTKEIDEICRYIKRHHRPYEISTANPKRQTEKLRALLSDGGIDRCHNLLDLVMADMTGQMNPIQNSPIAAMELLQQQLRTLHETEGQFTMKQLAINGSQIMKHFDLPAGPEIGTLLQACFEYALIDPSSRNQYDTLIKHIAKKIN